jgi:hypothetical protein
MFSYPSFHDVLEIAVQRFDGEALDLLGLQIQRKNLCIRRRMSREQCCSLTLERPNLKNKERLKELDNRRNAHSFIGGCTAVFDT